VGKGEGRGDPQRGWCSHRDYVRGAILHSEGLGRPEALQLRKSRTVRLQAERGQREEGTNLQLQLQPCEVVDPAAVPTVKALLLRAAGWDGVP